MKSDEEINILKAAFSLMEHLGEENFETVGTDKVQIFVYLESESQAKNVPKTWEGFKVVSSVIGKVQPL